MRNFYNPKSVIKAVASPFTLGAGLVTKAVGLGDPIGDAVDSGLGAVGLGGGSKGPSGPSNEAIAAQEAARDEEAKKEARRKTLAAQGKKLGRASFSEAFGQPSGPKKTLLGGTR